MLVRIVWFAPSGAGTPRTPPPLNGVFAGTLWIALSFALRATTTTIIALPSAAPIWTLRINSQTL